MVKVIDPLHSIEARGSVDTLTYNTHRGTCIVKARSGPAVTMSDAQIALRTLTAQTTASWQSLSDADRAGWDFFASANTSIDWTGRAKRLSGYNWYVRINVRRLLLGFAIEELPPIDRVTHRLLTLNIQDIGTQTIIYWTSTPYSPPPFCAVEIYAFGPHSPALNPTIKQAKRLGATDLNSNELEWPGHPLGTLSAFARIVQYSGMVGPWSSFKGAI